jgi:hypothetical protein
MEESMNSPISRRMMLRPLGGSAALALVPTRALSDTDEDGFRQTVIALLSRRHPEWHVELGADPQTIKIGTAEIYLAQDFQSRPHPLTDALFATNDSGIRLADAAAMRDHGR